MGLGKGLKESVLQQNMKFLSPEAAEQINRVIIGHAKEETVETGRDV